MGLTEERIKKYRLNTQADTQKTEALDVFKL